MTLVYFDEAMIYLMQLCL